MISTDEKATPDRQRIGDGFCSGILDLSALSPALAPYVDELSACLTHHGATLTSAQTQDTQLEGITAENWPLVMDQLNNKMRLGDRVARVMALREAVSDVLGQRVTPFVVNKVRINKPEVGRSGYAWHQDKATWPELVQTMPQLKGSYVFTLWICLTVSEAGNGLVLAPQLASADMVRHDYVENQGYFSAAVDGPSLKDCLQVYGPPMTAALFGQTVLHRSASGSTESRLSLDLRYFCGTD